MPNLADQLQQKINLKTKPLGALGKLEQIAFQIGTIQQTVSPTLNQPQLIVFAADHGIAAAGVSAYPSSVTPQMVLNFLNGGAAINVFCKQNNIQLTIVDAGVNYDFKNIDGLVNAKVNFGTKNFLIDKAITPNELELCFSHGSNLVNGLFKKGCNVIGFGEMGIGNTSSATLLMSTICSLPIADCVGRGTGLNDAQLQNKINILQEAKDFHGVIEDPMLALQTFGGFEIAQMTAAMLAAFDKKMLILIDGFIASAAFLIAYKCNSKILEHAIFCHLGDEHGHKNLLDYLGVEAILQLNMRVGEGTGCAIAYPIIQSAVNFLNEMSSFSDAGVDNKS